MTKLTTLAPTFLTTQYTICILLICFVCIPSDAAAAPSSTAQTTITTLVRDPQHIDLFWAGSDRTLWSVYWNPKAGWSQPFALCEHCIESRTKIVAVARTPTHIDLFWTSQRNVSSIFWDATTGWSKRPFAINKNQGKQDIDRNSVIVLAGDSNRLDVYWIQDGAAWWAYWRANQGWQPAGMLIEPSHPQALTAVSRPSLSTDLFWIDTSGNVWWLKEGLAEPEQLGAQANPNSAITAITFAIPVANLSASITMASFNEQHWTVAWVNQRGLIDTVSWGEGSVWKDVRSVKIAGRGQPTVTNLLYRTGNQSDLFWTTPDGGVWSSYTDANNNWIKPFALNAGAMKSVENAVVSEVARLETHIDVFYAGQDRGIWSTFWDASNGWAKPFRAVADGKGIDGSILIDHSQ